MGLVCEASSRTPAVEGSENVPYCVSLLVRAVAQVFKVNIARIASVLLRQAAKCGIGGGCAD